MWAFGFRVRICQCWWKAQSGLLASILERTTESPNTPRGRCFGWGTEPRPPNPPRGHSPVDLAEQRAGGRAGLCEDSNQPPRPSQANTVLARAPLTPVHPN